MYTPLYFQWYYTSIIKPCKKNKRFDLIPDEHSQQEVRQLGKSQAQWFTSNKVLGTRK